MKYLVIALIAIVAACGNPNYYDNPQSSSTVEYDNPISIESVRHSGGKLHGAFKIGGTRIGF